MQQGVCQSAVHGTFFLLQTPAPRLVGQSKQGREGTPGQMQTNKTAQQQQQNQIERDIDAVGWPKQRDCALVTP